MNLREMKLAIKKELIALLQIPGIWQMMDNYSSFEDWFWSVYPRGSIEKPSKASKERLKRAIEQVGRENLWSQGQKDDYNAMIEKIRKDFEKKYPGWNHP